MHLYFAGRGTTAWARQPQQIDILLTLRGCILDVEVGERPTLEKARAAGAEPRFTIHVERENGSDTNTSGSATAAMNSAAGKSYEDIARKVKLQVTIYHL